MGREILRGSSELYLPCPAHHSPFPTFKWSKLNYHRNISYLQQLHGALITDEQRCILYLDAKVDGMGVAPPWTGSGSYRRVLTAQILCFCHLLRSPSRYGSPVATSLRLWLPQHPFDGLRSEMIFTPPPCQPFTM